MKWLLSLLLVANLAQAQTSASVRTRSLNQLATLTVYDSTCGIVHKDSLGTRLWIDVMDIGHKTNLTAPIRAALAYNPKGGINLPSGSYSCDSISIPSNSTIMGNGTTLVGTASTIFNVIGTSGTHKSNVKISGVTLDANHVVSAGIVTIIYADNVEVTKCDFKNSTGLIGTSYGVYLELSSNVIVDANYFHDMSDSTHVIKSFDCQSLTITNNNITSGFRGIQIAHQTTPTTDSKFHVIAVNYVYGTQEGIVIGTGSGNLTANAVKYSHITNNTVEATAQQGLAIAGGSSYNTITGNTVIAAGYNGIIAERSANYNNFSDNRVQNCMRNGFEVYNSKGNTFVNNHSIDNGQDNALSDNARAGFDIVNDSSDVMPESLRVVGPYSPCDSTTFQNNFAYNVTGTTQSYGILAEKRSPTTNYPAGLTIKDNIFSPNRTGSVDILAAVPSVTSFNNGQAEGKINYNYGDKLLNTDAGMRVYLPSGKIYGVNVDTGHYIGNRYTSYVAPTIHYLQPSDANGNAFWENSASITIDAKTTGGASGATAFQVRYDSTNKPGINMDGDGRTSMRSTTYDSTFRVAGSMNLTGNLRMGGYINTGVLLKTPTSTISPPSNPQVWIYPDSTGHVWKLSSDGVPVRLDSLGGGNGSGVRIQPFAWYSPAAIDSQLVFVVPATATVDSFLVQDSLGASTINFKRIRSGSAVDMLSPNYTTTASIATPSGIQNNSVVALDEIWMVIRSITPTPRYVFGQVVWTIGVGGGGGGAGVADTLFTLSGSTILQTNTSRSLAIHSATSDSSATVGGGLSVTGGARIDKNLNVTGASNLTGLVTTTGGEVVGDSLHVDGLFRALSTATILGATTIGSTLDVTGNITAPNMTTWVTAYIRSTTDSVDVTVSGMTSASHVSATYADERDWPPVPIGAIPRSGFFTVKFPSGYNLTTDSLRVECSYTK